MIRVRWVVLAACLFLSLRAHANNSCSVWTTSLSFGSYDVFAATPLDSTGTVSWSCNPGRPVIWLGRGLGSYAQFSRRLMMNGSTPLQYALYLDAARTLVWGDGTDGSSVFMVTGKSGSTSIYGRVFARQLSARTGTYADTIVVTINF